MPTFYEYLRIKNVHFLAILRKAIKNGLILKIVRKKSLLFKISTQIFLKIRGGGSTSPLPKFRGGCDPLQLPPTLAPLIF